ncbi:hypothetical protein MUK42_23151 [Musa troglodytarum]|uniref:Uncharacterized protein n=1 Tax=Musa troglodytarum TaxID=320322 RepID=A0A9E7G7V8_9LILI|nr:hypothetical protein MUK42_23151 [Musa troglodytarum]
MAFFAIVRPDQPDDRLGSIGGIVRFDSSLPTSPTVWATAAANAAGRGTSFAPVSQAATSRYSPVLFSPLFSSPPLSSLAFHVLFTLSLSCCIPVSPFFSAPRSPLFSFTLSVSPVSSKSNFNFMNRVSWDFR